MRDPIEVQRELDAAQADLETKVGQLKEAISDKLEIPRKIVHAAEKPVMFVREHAVVVAVAVAGLALLFLALRPRRVT